LWPAIRSAALGVGLARAEPDVVDPFHDDDVRDAGLHQHVLVEA
jgi:hypothetical protein